MQRMFRGWLMLGLGTLAFWAFAIGLSARAGEERGAAPAALTYDEHIKPIFRQYCLTCHGEDKQEAGINLQSYGALLRGGSGGRIVQSGRASQSLLFQAITNEDPDVRMPPNRAPLPREQIERVRIWIESGLRENATGKPLVESRDLSFVPLTNRGDGLSSLAVLPANLASVELPRLVRPLPVLAMDASPGAPVVATAGQEHVLLTHTATREVFGRLAFPEGEPHVIRFSRQGNVLLVGGGRPVQWGRVVLYDVKSGKRLAEIGDEVDTVLAADISPDQRLIALGGSGRTIKIHSTLDGSLRHKLVKHTDWITAISFSPDGLRLATADRAGGIHLWDTVSGGIVLNLSEHKAAVHALDWRADGKLLVSASEDGKIIWWDAADGFPAITRDNAHPPSRPPGTYGVIPNGILAARFAPNGFLVTTGRDQLVQVWNPSGEPVKTFHAKSGLPISAALTFDGTTVIAGDTAGQVHFWEVVPRQPAANVEPTK
jgi:hypothetical protein